MSPMERTHVKILGISPSHCLPRLSSFVTLYSHWLLHQQAVPQSSLFLKMDRSSVCLLHRRSCQRCGRCHCCSCRGTGVREEEEEVPQGRLCPLSELGSPFPDPLSIDWRAFLGVSISTDARFQFGAASSSGWGCWGINR